VSHFSIQRSSNAKDFFTIGTIAAKNKPVNEYVFTDELPTNDLSTLHYRIQSIDKDGKEQYTIIKSINTNNTTPSIVVYPNPTKDYITINALEIIKEVKIINAFSQTVQHVVLHNKQATINLNQVPKGIYIIQITMSNGKTKAEKIIVH
jgi:hypothetical protein